MLNRGETLKLRDLNSAFTNPKTISLAYYQASLLVEHIVNAYGDAGLRKLVLEVTAANAEAIRLYQAAGYLKVGIHREHFFHDGRYEDVIVMEKKLAGAA